MEDIYQLVFFTGKKILQFTLNFKYEKETVERKEIKQIIEVEPEHRYQLIFHPFLYHYAIVTPKRVQIASFLFEEILFTKELEKTRGGLGLTALDKESNHLVMGEGEKVVEIYVQREKYNSWIYLVNNNLEELAYQTYKGDEVSVY